MTNNLRKIRLLKGMSQTELAEKANITRQTISKIENGSNDNPETKTALALANALDVQIEDIFLNKLSYKYDKKEAGALHETSK